jgi:hypothetical protein
MSRGRDTNQAYIYTRDDTEVDHEHGQRVVGSEIHELRRGTKYSAAHRLRSIAANDDPAPCTSKPNTSTANCCPTSSAGSWTATINA